jgi:hypothetical protein
MLAPFNIHVGICLDGGEVENLSVDWEFEFEFIFLDLAYFQIECEEYSTRMLSDPHNIVMDQNNVTEEK